MHQVFSCWEVWTAGGLFYCEAAAVTDAVCSLELSCMVFLKCNLDGSRCFKSCLFFLYWWGLSRCVSCPYQHKSTGLLSSTFLDGVLVWLLLCTGASPSICGWDRDQCLQTTMCGSVPEPVQWRPEQNRTGAAWGSEDHKHPIIDFQSCPWSSEISPNFENLLIFYKL